MFSLNKFILFIGAIILALSFGYYIFYINAPLDTIRSELPLPYSEVTLERKGIINKIADRFKKQAGIQAVVLHGVGGAGKTTIARQYASKQSYSSIWEVNAKNRETIRASFERLIYSACTTDDLKRELRLISNDSDIDSRERKLYLFFSRLVKKYDNWLLIYDDVRQFEDIKKYYPYDELVWGNGKVIITTRNSCIKDNTFIPDSNFINIPELTVAEKTKLFKKILPQNTAFLNDIPYQKLLEQIPSFPLDVITAAYYIKEEKIPFSKYLNYIRIHDGQFARFQEEILSNVGNYDQSRYGIISTSVKNLIDDNDNIDQLLLLCLLDTRNIPYNLITKDKSPDIIDQINNMLKLALVSTEDKARNFISIHKTTQVVMLSTILSSLSDKRIKTISDKVILDFLEYLNDNLSKFGVFERRLMISHIHKVLENVEILSSESELLLKQALGEYYLRVDEIEKAKEIFQQIIVNNKKSFVKDASRIATSMVLLAICNISHHENSKAKELLIKANEIFQKSGKNDNDVAWTLVWLGVIKRNCSDYKQSIDLLNQAIEIYEKNDEKQDLYWAYVYLASAYDGIGNYNKSKTLLEKSRKFFIENNGSEHLRNAWVSTYLGKVYTKIGEHDKAEELLDLSHTLHTKFFGVGHDKVGWSKENLAYLHKNLGNYKKSIQLANQALNIYYTYKPVNHLALSRTKMILSNVYAATGEYNKAVKFAHESLNDLKRYHGKHYYGEKNTLITEQVKSSIGVLCGFNSVKIKLRPASMIKK